MQSFASPETFPISKIASQEMAIYFCLGAGANLAEVRVMMRMPGIEITLTKMLDAKMIGRNIWIEFAKLTAGQVFPTPMIGPSKTLLKGP